jgi:hypothetical protein
MKKYNEVMAKENCIITSLFQHVFTRNFMSNIYMKSKIQRVTWMRL